MRLPMLSHTPPEVQKADNLLLEVDYLEKPQHSRKYPAITPTLFARIVRFNAIWPIYDNQEIEIFQRRFLKENEASNEFIANFLVAFLTDASFTIRSFNQVNAIYQINWLDKITNQIADQIDQEEDIKTKLIIFISAIKNNFQQMKNLSDQEVADMVIEILKTSFN
jgi:hypothetical protein